jgi:hypothetical protein
MGWREQLTAATVEIEELERQLAASKANADALAILLAARDAEIVALKARIAELEAQPTPEPEPVPEPTPEPPPVSDRTFKLPADGAVVSGVLPYGALEVTGSNIVKVVFFAGSTQLNTETAAPWQGGPVDTTKYANALLTLGAKVTGTDGVVEEIVRLVTVANTAPAPTPTPVSLKLGVYRWFPPTGPEAVDKFSAWLGKQVMVASMFCDGSTWGGIDSPNWQLGPWSSWVKAKAGRNLSIAVPIVPPGGSLAACARGDYDSHWKTLANNIAANGLLSAYLRLGWEMDGGWYSWAANLGSGKEASFAAAFRRIVTVMREARPTNAWKFVFNPTTDAGKSLSWLQSAWPGDAYVDVLGVDHYDASWATNTYPYPSTCDAACRLARQKTAWDSNAVKLNVVRDFALARGKPLAFPEWGVTSRSDGHGGLDDPYFIQKMHEFMSNPANKVDHHIYMNISDAANAYDSRITDDWTVRDSPTGPTKYPLAAAKYKQLFGA